MARAHYSVPRYLVSLVAAIPLNNEKDEMKHMMQNDLTAKFGKSITYVKQVVCVLEACCIYVVVLVDHLLLLLVALALAWSVLVQIRLDDGVFHDLLSLLH